MSEEIKLTKRQAKKYALIVTAKSIEQGMQENLIAYNELEELRESLWKRIGVKECDYFWDCNDTISIAKRCKEVF